MDKQEITRKADHLDQVLDAAPDRIYRGAANAREIGGYLDHIHTVLSEAIFDGYEGKYDGNAQRDHFKELILGAYARSPEHYLDSLRSGDTYDLYAKALLADRLVREVGPRYRNKALSIDNDIKVHMQSRAIVGIEDDFGSLHMFFNPLGVVLMSKDIKEAALSHEAAHIALGHANKDYTPPDDRRQMELDANYVGALIYGNPEKYNALNRFSLEGIRSVDTEQHLGERKARMYESKGRRPGEDAWADGQIDRAIAEERFHFDYARRLTYPAQEEKIAQIDALQEELNHSRIKSWAIREKLREAIRDRHVGRGKEP